MGMAWVGKTFLMVVATVEAVLSIHLRGMAE